MKLAIRVGNSVTDLFQYTRVAMEAIGSRTFLVGVRNSGKVIALYVMKPTFNPHTVAEAIQAAIGTFKSVCVLTDELREVTEDADALAALESFRGNVERPNTLAGALAAGELGYAPKPEAEPKA